MYCTVHTRAGGSAWRRPPLPERLPDHVSAFHESWLFQLSWFLKQRRLLHSTTKSGITAYESCLACLKKKKILLHTGQTESNRTRFNLVFNRRKGGQLRTNKIRTYIRHKVLRGFFILYVCTTAGFPNFFLFLEQTWRMRLVQICLIHCFFQYIQFGLCTCSIIEYEQSWKEVTVLLRKAFNNVNLLSSLLDCKFPPLWNASRLHYNPFLYWNAWQEVEYTYLRTNISWKDRRSFAEGWRIEEVGNGLAKFGRDERAVSLPCVYVCVHTQFYSLFSFFKVLSLPTARNKKVDKVVSQAGRRELKTKLNFSCTSLFCSSTARGKNSLFHLTLLTHVHFHKQPDLLFPRFV